MPAALISEFLCAIWRGLLIDRRMAARAREANRVVSVN